jgi:hypothetical protein
MKKLLLSLLCVFSTQSFAGSHAFNNWKPYGWKKVKSKTYYIDSARKNIDVVFYTDDKNSQSIDIFFEEVAELTYHFLGSRVAIGGASRYGKCNSYRLVVYDLSYANVNNRSVMYWYPWQSRSQNLYGAYDSVYTDSKKTAVIILTKDAPNQTRKKILAHELVHYWHDMCLGGENNVGEAHASAVEGLFD